MTTTTNTPESLPAAPAPGQNEPTPHRSAKSRKRGLIWALFLLIIASVAGYAVWKASQPAASKKGPAGAGAGGRGGGGRGGSAGLIPVVVTTVTRSDMPVVLNGLGNVVPYYNVTIKSRVDGQLQQIHYTEGQLVKEGQLLVEIDPRPYEVQRSLYEATLARDQAILANARVDLGRYQELVKTDAIPSQQLDTQKALVAQYEAIVKQDQANIANANLNLEYCRIKAPITGVLGLRLVDLGNMVRAGDNNGMVTIAQLQPISVIFTIPEDNVAQVARKLRSGQRLPVDAYNRDHSAKLASGMVMTVENVIDATTGTVRLKARFENENNELFPNQFVNMDVLVDTLKNQIVVPNVAVQNGQQGTFVYVVDDQSKVHLRTVQTGINNSTLTNILGGLSVGDRVVIDGTDRLVEGATVRVRRPGEFDNTDSGGRGGRGRGARGAGRGADADAENGHGGAPSGRGNLKKGEGGFRRGPGGGGGR